MSETAAATSGATADLWQNLLRETAAKAKIKDSTLFVLGDRCSGKNSLLRSLRFKHDFHADSNTHHFPEALAYSYFTLFDPEDPDSDNMGLPTKVNVWTLGNVAYKSLLNTAICNGDLEHTTIAIIVNLSKPYNVLAELHKWLEVVEGTFKEPFSNLPLEKQAFLKEKIQSLFNAKSSTETGDDAESKADSNEKMAEQTGESNTIKIETNLGVSIIVIGSMSDHLLDQRAKSRLSADQCDFLQMHLRRVCLKYGAALCYTSSVRGSTNNSLLQKYLLHRMYPTQYTFGENAEVIQRDSIFVPAGWDTQSHINEIVDKASKISIDAAFNDVITFPSDAELTTNVPRSHAPLQPSLKALEYQAFLKVRILCSIDFSHNNIIVSKQLNFNFACYIDSWYSNFWVKI